MNEWHPAFNQFNSLDGLAAHAVSLFASAAKRSRSARRG